jgi:hypothetical protein
MIPMTRIGKDELVFEVVVSNLDDTLSANRSAV